MPIECGRATLLSMMRATESCADTVAVRPQPLHDAIVSVLQELPGADLFTLENETGIVVDELLPVTFELGADGVVVAEWRYKRHLFRRPTEFLWFTRVAPK